MTRRLRIAGTAFGALLVPACAGFQPDATVMHPITPPVPPGVRTPAPTVVAPVQAARSRTVEKFAEGRTDEPSAVAERPTPAPPPLTTAAGPVEPKVAPPPAPTGTPVVPAPASIQQTKIEKPIEPPPPIDPPRVPVPAVPTGDGVIRPAPEPVPDAEGVIRASWPTIKGLPTDAAKDEPNLTLPTPDALPPAKPGLVEPAPLVTPVAAPAEAPAAIAPPPAGPPMLPPGVIGTTAHQANASPVAAEGTEPAVAPPVVKPAPTGADSPLLKAVRAFTENRPDEAVEHLKAYDPATQQIFLSLLPALGRLGEGKLQEMKPEEMDVLLGQLTKVPNMLRPRASLQAANVRLCREVHNFGHAEPFPDRHTFRPGDIVYLYMELANFTCVPDPKGGGYTVTLASAMELKDAAGAVVWRADPKEVPDHVTSPPQDYYRNFRLSVPGVPPGTYTLAVKTTDRPSGRVAHKTIELRVGAR